jgi:hypothetical protein
MPARVLIVDDEPDILDLLRTLLGLASGVHGPTTYYMLYPSESAREAEQGLSGDDQELCRDRRYPSVAEVTDFRNTSAETAEATTFSEPGSQL